MCPQSAQLAVEVLVLPALEDQGIHVISVHLTLQDNQLHNCIPNPYQGLIEQLKAVNSPCGIAQIEYASDLIQDKVSNWASETSISGSFSVVRFC